MGNMPKFRVDADATPAGAGIGYRFVICVEDDEGKQRPVVERKTGDGPGRYLAFKQEAIATEKLYEVHHHNMHGIPSAQIVDLATYQDGLSETTVTDDRPMPSPTEEEIASPEFQAIYNCIKTWDVNVPAYYQGYCEANGSHAKLILDALADTRRHAIFALGYLSSVLATRARAWEGEAPEWFPEPPEWLAIFEEGLRRAPEAMREPEDDDLAEGVREGGA